MAWSTLPAYSDGTALTAAMLTAIKDNINETAPAKATTAGRIFVATAANAIAERAIQQSTDANSGATTSSSFTNLNAPAVSGPALNNVTTGALALVVVEAQINNTSGGASSRMSYEVLNATSSAATDDRGLLDQNTANYDNRYATLELQSLTAGTNDFRSRYRVSSGTGNFSARGIIVMAL